MYFVHSRLDGSGGKLWIFNKNVTWSFSLCLWWHHLNKSFFFRCTHQIGSIRRTGNWFLFCLNFSARKNNARVTTITARALVWIFEFTSSQENEKKRKSSLPHILTNTNKHTHTWSRETFSNSLVRADIDSTVARWRREWMCAKVSSSCHQHHEGPSLRVLSFGERFPLLLVWVWRIFGGNLVSDLILFWVLEIVVHYAYT